MLLKDKDCSVFEEQLIKKDLKAIYKKVLQTILEDICNFIRV